MDDISIASSVASSDATDAINVNLFEVIGVKEAENTLLRKQIELLQASIASLNEAIRQYKTPAGSLESGSARVESENEE